MSLELIYIDFEYQDTGQPDLTLVCVVTYRHGSKPQAWWLHRDPAKQQQFRSWIEQHQSDVFVSFQAAAEARAFLSLGIRAHDYRWIDVMIAYRMLLNHGDVDFKATSLIHACEHFGVLYSHASEKESIRDLIIIHKRGEFSNSERSTILLYCAEDTTVLRSLLSKMLRSLSSVYHAPRESFLKYLMRLSAFQAFTAQIERSGMPIDIEAVNNLINNYKLAKFYFIEQCSYPFYQFKSYKNDYSFTVSIFEDFLKSSGLYKEWPKTESGACSFDVSTLEERSIYSEHIQSLYSVRRLETALRSFNPEKSVIRERIGSDHRLRPYFNAFGTKTSRNAPPARFFPFAMPSVFRCLIRPAPGRVITGMDWSSQEFALAAWISKDPAMLEAYASTDPYLWMAKKAGLVPPEGTRAQYEDERNMMKSLTLGIQYGMGVKKLARKISADTGREMTIAGATRLRNIHMMTFKLYWKHVDRMKTMNRCGGVQFARDGWAFQHRDARPNTSINWPVQTHGAVLMRYAVKYAIEAGLTVIAPLHDCIYIEHAASDTAAIPLLESCMSRAVDTVFPGLVIRTDHKSHDHDTPWVEKRSAQLYEVFKKFLTADPGIKTKAIVNPTMENYNLFELLNEMEGD